MSLIIRTATVKERWVTPGNFADSVSGAPSLARIRRVSEPLAYFLTFRCYGTWLHGDERGSVHHARNRFGTPLDLPDLSRYRAAQAQMADSAFNLDPQQRRGVEQAIADVCRARSWHLHAVNARSNHVHLVVSSPETVPELVLRTMKAYATRALRQQALVASDARIWARHGSTRYLWTERDVSEACWYVTDRQ